MAGSSNITGDESILFADNASFDGTERGGKLTTDGQLWIGATASPHVRKGSLTAGVGVSITNGAGTITIGLAGGSAPVQHLTADTGGLLNPDGSNNFNIVSTATNGIDTSGSGSTITIGMASPYADASFAFARSASGATNTLTISNTSNTASSNALLQNTVAGTSAGDAFQTFTVTGTTNWSQGIDNSVSGDPFVLSASTALGTSNTLVVETSGNATFNNIATSAEVTLALINSDTNAASNARINSSVVNASAADPYLQVSVAATSNYCWGIDNSDSDKLKICFDPNANSATPSGSNNYWTMTNAGERTMPLQPAFLGTTAGATDVTGDGTVYPVGSSGTAFTEIYDQGGDFNTNGTFTAPVTGRYLFASTVQLGGVLNTHTDGYLNFAASNRNISPVNQNPYTLAVSGRVIWSGSTFMDMDAADTIVMQLSVSGGTKVVDITANANTTFSGSLIC